MVTKIFFSKTADVQFPVTGHIYEISALFMAVSHLHHRGS